MVGTTIAPVKIFRSVPAVLLAVLLGLALTGCGDDELDRADGSQTPDDSGSEATDATDLDASEGTNEPSPSAKESLVEPSGDKTLLKADQWKELCFFSTAEVDDLVPTYAPYGPQEGGADNLDASGAPVDLHCQYTSADNPLAGVQVMARPYVEDVDYEEPNNYASPTEAWEDACRNGSFDCGKLPGDTPYAIFGDTGFGALYPEGYYYYQVGMVGQVEDFKGAEVKAMVEALEAEVAAS